MSERVYQPESKASDYFLGDWRLCVRTNLLVRADARVELENRLVLLLVFFIEHAGEILGKERILKTIWQGKVVNEDSLAVAISHLRKALGDNSRSPKFIKTIPGVGYQFIAKAGVLVPAEPASENEQQPIILPNNKTRLVIITLAILLACLLALFFVQGAPGVILDEPMKASQGLTSRDQDLWKQAQQQLAERSPAALKSAIRILRELLQQAPDYAPAYAAIAEAKIKILQDQLGQKEHCTEVLGLLSKSLALDAQQQNVLVMRGNLLFWCVRDYAAVERDYRQAIAMDAQDDVAPMQYAQLLLAQGRFVESLQQVELSRQLNPLNYSIPTVVWIYQMQARDDLALKELERINSAEPGDRYFHVSAQRVYARLGRAQDSMEHLLWLMRDAGYTATDIAAAQTAFSSGGLAAVNRWLLERRDSADLGQYIPPLSWARYALAAGELDIALGYLEQAFAARQSALLWGNVDPAYDPVRTHPRFQVIMQQLQQMEFQRP